MQTLDVESRLNQLYESLAVTLDKNGELSQMDSLMLVHLVEKIEEAFSIHIRLLDLDPRDLRRHGQLVALVQKYLAVQVN